MKKTITLLSLIFYSLGSVWAKSFVHTVTTTSLSNGQSYINHPDLNNRGATRAIVTQYYTAATAVYNNHEVAIYPEVTGAEIKWMLYNVDGSPVPLGATFVVHIPDSKDIALFYDHNAAATTVVSLSDANLNTYLNSPVFLTQVNGGNPNAVAANSNANNFRIAGCGGSSIPSATSYNIFMHRGINCFVHKSSAANSLGESTYLDHPALNNNSEALISLTLNSTNLKTPLGVWYNSSLGKWGIFTQNGSNFPVDVALNIYFENGLDFTAYDAFAHTTTAANINYFTSVIDHPALNGKPEAKPIVTMLYNTTKFPGTTISTKKVGVFYITDSGKWGLYTVDKTDMPVNVVYNIMVPSKHVVMDSVTTAKRLGLLYNFSEALPVVKNNPHAPILFTEAWKGSAYDTAYTGLVYLGGSWLLRNKSATDIPDRTRFHFMPVYGANCVVLNSSTGIYIDHPKANNNPNAALFVAPVYNALGATTAQVQTVSYNFMPVYDGQKWWVNFQNNPTNLGVNVFIGEYQLLSAAADVQEVTVQASFYPNPAKDRIVIKEGVDKATLIDLHGQPLKTYLSGDGNLELDGIGAGIYLLKIEGHGKTSIEKLVISSK